MLDIGDTETKRKDSKTLTSTWDQGSSLSWRRPRPNHQQTTPRPNTDKEENQDQTMDPRRTLRSRSSNPRPDRIRSAHCSNWPQNAVPHLRGHRLGFVWTHPRL